MARLGLEVPTQNGASRGKATAEGQPLRRLPTYPLPIAGTPLILIVSHPEDLHTTAVLAELAGLGANACVLDLSAFPRGSSLSMHYRSEGNGTSPLIQYALPGTEPLDLSSVSAAWWRRPQLFQFSPSLRRNSHYRFAYNECQQVVDALWRMLRAEWVNDPRTDETAHKKPLQLAVAREVGLLVPETLITNSEEKARAFLEGFAGRPVVFKSLSATVDEWRETRLMAPTQLARLHEVEHAPVIFQEYVAGVDIRVTVVDRQLFAAEIDARQSSYPVDFRMSMDNARIRPTVLPKHVAGRLLALMDRLGLVYGAIDLRRDDDDRFHFLEVNPAGQWLFVEQQTGQSISRTLATYLYERDQPA